LHVDQLEWRGKEHANVWKDTPAENLRCQLVNAKRGYQTLDMGALAGAHGRVDDGTK
jgi:hypothetical protein